MLYKGANTYNINSCETIEVFYNLRTDLDKLKYAAYITKIIMDVTVENQNSYKILQLFLNTLYMISESDKEINLIISIFRIRLMCILGFVPNFGECMCCKQKENLGYFSIKDGTIKCKLCGKQDTSSIEISEATQRALKYIIMAPAKKIYSFNVTENIIKELEIISKLYLSDKLEKDYRLDW